MEQSMTIAERHDEPGASASPTGAPAGAVREVTLPIDGMTCASCVRRVERALDKVDGVAEANVNLATERARVRFDPTRADLADLKQAVEAAGYRVPEAPASEPEVAPAEATEPPAAASTPNADGVVEATLPI